jgi:hypothetical protein
VAAIEPESTCGSCEADLHACVNCRHFDTTAPNECRESIEVRISAKSRRNECGLFAAKLVQEFGSDSGSKDDPKAAFDALFDL